ncbi:DUF2357 domain-containing protein [Cyclobacterium amurskyense]|uniref:DUF2357 domain-containing protein n=1 Tax=Cyclobacterium amurskyense TaxID=320787 RepID=A0A0H4PT48_9BACT|nr:DUF2357 domain-containing protein [Cyclobacterium amurskyense]AKP51497.1 hypothetical protein CA2015_2073 [Cyclobacterium amurskyense]
MNSVSYIDINLDSIEEGLKLTLDPSKPNTLFDALPSAFENNEARFQLVEGCDYYYTFSDPNFIFGNTPEQIVRPHPRNKHTGTISPNIFVGTLSLPVIKLGDEDPIGQVKLEVQSVKSGYRDDYRDMLELITEKCTDLLFQANSPVSHYFEVDFSKDSKTNYQRFAFIKSVIDTDEFSEAIHRIVSAPVTNWSEITESKDIRQVRRFSNANVKEILRGGRRTALPTSHYLRSVGLETLPERIMSNRKIDTVDTPENRFIKHALGTFLKFCMDINAVSKTGSRIEQESKLLIRELESQLHHTVFKDISRPTTLRISSPILQRKEGYREVLRVWLMFDLAAKLIWSGGDDVYSGSKKDIATLYEYWLFFKLLDLFQDLFDIEPKDINDLIKPTDDGLSLQLKQGEHTALRGIYNSGTRKLNIKFNYNRPFSGKKEYPASGSWTTTLRPDYTLSFWPIGISEEEAELQELIVHIHFDAKYKVANLNDLLDEHAKEELKNEKTENRKGIYKNADLLKMHAYKDAIRRTGGAYVLYPGGKPVKQRGFHEIIPGLGAFPVSPSKKDSGIGDLKAFITEVIDHFINRASQRERFAYRTFDVFKDPPEADNEVNDSLPEPINSNRDLIPNDTFVMVGFYKSQEHLEWIKRNNLYNVRTGTGNGSIVLDIEHVSAKYLLLHTKGDASSGELWRIVKKGPRLFSQGDLIKKRYPSPSQYNYLVFEIEPVSDPEFENVKWDFRKLNNYVSGRPSAIPFTANMAELMKCKIR